MKILTPAGGSDAARRAAEWAARTTQDVDSVDAMAPNGRIGPEACREPARLKREAIRRVARELP